MNVDVEVTGKLVNVTVSFLDSLGAPVAAPVGATYAWTVTTGTEVVSVAGNGVGGATGVVTPLATGTAKVGVSVSGGGLAAPLVGNIDITVLEMAPFSVELNGVVVNAV